MRPLLFAAAFAICAGAAAAEDAPDARAAYVERRGLIEADAQCRLFNRDIRAALAIGAARTRGALLRSGWTTAQVRSLEQAVVAAARGRACDDPRTASSAAQAREAFGAWVNARTMEFPGWRRTWIARRGAADGWRLSQAVEAPEIAVFGVRTRGGVERLALVMPLQRNEAAPDSAQLIMRDTARARAEEITLPQRVAYGLAAGAPRPGGAAGYASARSIERLDHGAAQAVFVFPDRAFHNLLELDPRESLEIRVQWGRRQQRLLVEVGDVAAARDFLTIR